MNTVELSNSHSNYPKLIQPNAWPRNEIKQTHRHGWESAVYSGLLVRFIPNNILTEKVSITAKFPLSRMLSLYYWSLNSESYLSAFFGDFFQKLWSVDWKKWSWNTNCSQQDYTGSSAVCTQSQLKWEMDYFLQSKWYKVL